MNRQEQRLHDSLATVAGCLWTFGAIGLLWAAMLLGEASRDGWQSWPLSVAFAAAPVALAAAGIAAVARAERAARELGHFATSK